MERDESEELLCIDGKFAGHKVAHPGLEFAFVEATSLKSDSNGQSWYRLYRDADLGLVWAAFNGPSAR